jgi:carbohydrate kinase (thermoresistant glucokinase family)
MAAGFPLSDEDRWPWLRQLAGWLGDQDRAGSCSVLTCSALRRPYRDLLREGAAGVYFVHLVGDKSLLLERMQSREDHFMPPELLESQLDTLEPLEADERGVLVDVANPPERIGRIVMAQLDQTSREP